VTSITNPFQERDSADRTSFVFKENTRFEESFQAVKVAVRSEAQA
jgi:hypothetical protein